MTAETTPLQPPVVLSIAGSDSGGGAGIQADLKTFHAFGTFGTTAVTAITAQNTLGVQGVHPIPVPMVQLQIEAVVNDLAPAAVKTGMLATAELVSAVADSIRQHAMPNFVLDPVMVATSGDRLLDADAEGTLARELLPLALIITPNLDEAALLTGRSVATVADMRGAATELVAAGAGAALVKGGHLAGAETVDVLWDGERFHEWHHPRVHTRSTHGTGCTLSAAIAAGLAHGRPLLKSVEDALGFVRRAIIAAPGYGRGNGPINHFVEWRMKNEE